MIDDNNQDVTVDAPDSSEAVVTTDRGPEPATITGLPFSSGCLSSSHVA